MNCFLQQKIESSFHVKKPDIFDILTSVLGIKTLNRPRGLLLSHSFSKKNSTGVRNNKYIVAVPLDNYKDLNLNKSEIFG